MRYQSPSDRVIVAQLPTSDWRDEQWVLGYGLFVNTIVYAYLKLLNREEDAEKVKDEMGRFVVTGGRQHRHVHEGLVLPKKPYYALWSYKVYKSERFDLLGNCLAILSGIASPTRARSMVSWIEKECDHLREKGLLGVNLPPNFFPYIQPTDPDWRPRYKKYNLPGEYHNGGIWPFIVSNTTINKVMTPLKNTQLISVHSNRQEVLDVFEKCDYARLPVYENTQDNIVGFINVYGVLCSKKKFSNLYNFVKPIKKINQKTLVTDAIEAMQAEKEKMSLVVRSDRKRHETPIGVITMKDLVEELFGELGSW